MFFKKETFVHSRYFPVWVFWGYYCFVFFINVSIIKKMIRGRGVLLEENIISASNFQPYLHNYAIFDLLHLFKYFMIPPLPFLPLASTYHAY